MYRLGWESWLDQAVCREVDPDLFFIENIDGESRRQIRQAKRVCYTCPVINQCLEYSLVNRIPYGIFGGLDWSERQQLIRARDNIAAASA